MRLLNTWLIMNENDERINGESKSSRNFLTTTVWCTVSSYRLDRVLLATSTSKFFKGSVATNGRQGQWFLHHDNAPSHTSLVVSSPSHRTLQVSRRVTVGCSAFRRCFQQGQDRCNKCVCVCVRVCVCVCVSGMADKAALGTINR
jgi:hypothetical protein